MHYAAGPRVASRGDLQVGELRADVVVNFVFQVFLLTL